MGSAPFLSGEAPITRFVVIKVVREEVHQLWSSSPVPERYRYPEIMIFCIAQGSGQQQPGGRGASSSCTGEWFVEPLVLEACKCCLGPSKNSFNMSNPIGSCLIDEFCECSGGAASFTTWAIYKLHILELQHR